MRPDWRGATIEGIAPLMSPREVAAALARGGYVHVPCVPGEPLAADPFKLDHDLPCFASPRSATRISLYFLDLPEGRRLAVANFSTSLSMDQPEAVRIERGRRVAARLRARLGPPHIVSTGYGFRTLYWKRPGGDPSLPDLVSTTIGKYSGANATLTSMWAYGQERPDGG